ncbi:MAG: hypothetical protein LC732_11255, partial [Acidobacteria bacterium]|nr:hypothetical protein [Acidobacteriota bacterium]
KTYRIFFTELPPEEAISGTAVRVLMRMGVPVFVGPAKPEIAARLGDLSMNDGKFDFSFVNDGNTFTMIRDAKLIGMDEAGNPLFEKQISGWYVLAGGRRDYSVPLEASDCEDLRKIAVVLTHGVDDRVALEAETPAKCPTEFSPRPRGQASSDQ